MALCVNDSGTWREITTQCVNDSGTWREVATGCINESGTWREFGFTPALGSAYEGGYLICQASSLRWIVAPSSSQVSRSWYNRNNAITTAQSVSGCTGWFIPSIGQLQNPGFACRTYWDSHTGGNYWSSQDHGADPNAYAFYVNMSSGGSGVNFMTNINAVRAFRTVSY